MKRALGLAFGFVLAFPAIAESAPIPLWPDDPSTRTAAAETVRLTEQGEHVVANVNRPSLTPYIPDGDGTDRTAVIVIPGGGHRELWMDHEGYRVGAWLAAHGIAAFVVKYRLARETGSPYTMSDELADIQRAIRQVRGRAGEWHIAPERIGVIGFSAGGELAALAGTEFEGSTTETNDSIDRQSDRPDFVGLIYPAIPKDLPLTKDSPPAFLLCGSADSPEISEGVPALYSAIRHAGGSAEMHVLAGIGHGFGIRDTNPPSVKIWPDLFYDWLVGLGFGPAK